MKEDLLNQIPEHLRDNEHVLAALGMAGEGKPTLRDQFAMAVLPALVHSQVQTMTFGPDSLNNNEKIANISYVLADAMLEARKPAKEK